MGIYRKRLLSTLLSLSLIGGLISSCKTTDLRPEGYLYARNIEKAKQLLEEMGKAHQIENWNNLETYNIVFEGEFYGFGAKNLTLSKNRK